MNWMSNPWAWAVLAFLNIACLSIYPTWANGLGLVGALTMIILLTVVDKK